ncbi:hypothetical protein JXR93_08920 [bacterium]|nr:hypothetical protein [bacterium]
MIKHLYLVNLIFIIFLISCTEANQVLIIASASISDECASFNRDGLKWVPYKEESSIILLNQELNHSIILPIKRVSQVYSAEGFSDAGNCDGFITINGGYNETSLFSCKLYISSGDLSSEEYIFKFNDGEILFSSKESIQKSMGNYSLNGVNYDLVKVFENSETYTNSLTNEIKYSKLIVAKGVGVIAIIDNQNRVWSIVNSIQH